jgi:ADP-ribosylglycohydrolase/catechol 2,3-dioxygenase-like lactoylglutathione lyase family enzyme
MADVSSELALDVGQRAEAAVLAAAAGDALGWPQENRSARVGGRRGVEPQLAFHEWRRREGGSYAPHEELIAPGTYSDDTQLILALGRSLLRGPAWWRHFTTVELPFWPMYQRGGGGATRRAASSWAKGKAPWLDAKTALDYFDAGGNGVAMRVLPHAIRHARDTDFGAAAADILADGITTHGHPRALVGALAYGYVLWGVLRRSETLGYGQLIEEALGAKHEWGRRPRVDHVDSTWEQTITTSARESYDSVWNQTVDEMVDLLHVAHEGIDKGALAIDREILERLGSVSGSSRGAGTVTAAAAIFLASRYAARPTQGLLAAAFARGADTDTIASMVGAVLGAINGDEWLGRTLEMLQDRPYLSLLARHLEDGAPLAPTEDGVPQLNPAALRKFWDELRKKSTGGDIVLPDGRLARILGRVEHDTRSRTNEITSWQLEAGDGQTLSLKRVTKRKEDVLSSTPPAVQAPPPARRYRIGVVVEVDDLQRAIHFYRDTLGLEISKQSPNYTGFSGLLALAPASSPRVPVAPGSRQLKLEDSQRLFESRQTVTIFYSSAELEHVRSRLLREGASVSEYSERHGRRMFRCLDPEGNVLEFRELNGG